MKTLANWLRRLALYLDPPTVAPELVAARLLVAEVGVTYAHFAGNVRRRKVQAVLKTQFPSLTSRRANWLIEEALQGLPN